MKKQVVLKESELRNIIQEEAKKVQQIMMLESERVSLMNELKEIYKEFYDANDQGNEIEEIFGLNTAALKKQLDARLLAWKSKGAVNDPTPDVINKFWVDAKADSYNGAPGIDANKNLIYTPSTQQRSSANASTAFTEGEDTQEEGFGGKLTAMFGAFNDEAVKKAELKLNSGKLRGYSPEKAQEFQNYKKMYESGDQAAANTFKSMVSHINGNNNLLYSVAGGKFKSAVSYGSEGGTGANAGGGS